MLIAGNARVSPAITKESLSLLDRLDPQRGVPVVRVELEGEFERAQGFFALPRSV